MIDRDLEKLAAARAALAYAPENGVLGVGGGTTVARFVEVLVEASVRPRVVVAASEITRAALEAAGIAVTPLETINAVDVYIDGADEIDPLGRLIKGAGGAATMEKVIASAAGLFVVIADESKVVARLGEHAAVPVEVLPPATGIVGKRLEAQGGRVKRRAGYVTDSRNSILDVVGLDLSEPERLEVSLDAIPGLVECGLFAARRADIAFIGRSDGTARRLEFPAKK